MGRSVGCDDGSGRAQTIHGCADDSASKAGPFSTGVKALDPGALASQRVAEDSDGRAAAGLGARQCCLFEEAPVKPPVHDWQTVNQGLGDLFGQEAIQVGGYGAPAIARRKLAPAWSGQQEVAAHWIGAA